MKHLLNLVENFVRSNFDKLLLVGILGLLVWIGSRSSADDVKTWAMGQANTVIGAIIMLVTGKVVQRMSNADTTEKTVVHDEMTIKKKETE